MRIKQHEGEEEGCPLLWQVVIISVYVTKTCLIMARQTCYGNSNNFTVLHSTEVHNCVQPTWQLSHFNNCFEAWRGTTLFLFHLKLMLSLLNPSNIMANLYVRGVSQL